MLKEKKNREKKFILMLGRKFANYRLHIAGIAQNNQKCFAFIVVPQDTKNFSQIRSKRRKIKNYINN